MTDNDDFWRDIKIMAIGVIIGIGIAFMGSFIYTYFFQKNNPRVVPWMAGETLHLLPLVIITCAVIWICLFFYKLIIIKGAESQAAKIKQETESWAEKQKQQITMKECAADEKIKAVRQQEMSLDLNYQIKRSRYKFEIDALRRKNRLLQLAFRNPGRAKRTAKKEGIKLELT